MQALFAVSAFLHAERHIAGVQLLVIEVNINPVGARCLTGTVFKHRQVGSPLLRVVDFQQCRVKEIARLRPEGHTAQHGQVRGNQIRQPTDAGRRPVPGLACVVIHPYDSVTLQGEATTLGPYPHCL
ncbi:hypothetical protein D3C79_833850 [compost metagenome]